MTAISSTQINEHNLVPQLMAMFPELEEDYQAEIGKWKGERSPSNYDVIGFVFKPHFKKELRKGTLTDFLRRSAAFMERVCESGDLEAVNVIWVKIFEWLILSEPRYLDVIWPVLGIRTKAAIKDARQRWKTAGKRL